MVMLDVLEELLDEAFSMIDPRWGAKFQVLLEVRKLQRRSPDGWAYVGYQPLATRLCCKDTWTWELIGVGDPKKGKRAPGTKPSTNGLMWRHHRILVIGPPPAGSRPRGFGISPLVDQWRDVRWRERDPEVRRWRLDPYLRELREGLTEDVVPRLGAAERTRLVPRLAAAELRKGGRQFVPRLDSKNKQLASSAAGSRGTNDVDRRPSSYRRFGETDVSPPKGRRRREQTAFAQRINGAVMAKYGTTAWSGAPLDALEALEGRASEERIIQLVMAAPQELKLIGLFEEWIPMALEHGIPGHTEPADPQLDRVHRELAKVERSIHAMQLAGEEPDPNLIAVRDRWQNEVDQLTGSQP